MKSVNVGLIGLGTVGSGVAKLLTENPGLLRDRLGADIVLKKAADKDTSRAAALKLKPGVFTEDASAILNDPSIDIVIELVGGTTIAKDFVLKAIENGKHVVTANKALLSSFGKEIFGKAEEKGVSIGFEASVAGGIPVIKGLKEGLAANKIDSIYGIINGTANFILTKMTNEGGDFDRTLKEAQRLGYAEADPTYDIEGIDTAHKLAILINLAYGTFITHKEIYTEGITRITDLDIEYARELGYKIKLLAIAKDDGASIEARVHPTMIPEKHLLSAVDGVFNAVHITGDAVGPVLFYGRGAGMMPTASAVVADILDISRNIVNNVKSPLTPLGYVHEAVTDRPIKAMEDIASLYYIRFTAVDKPGVLSKISGVLGNHNISISSVIQKGQKSGEAVPLVIITYKAFEKEIRAALNEIEKLDIIEGKEVFIRIEEN